MKHIPYFTLCLLLCVNALSGQSDKVVVSKKQSKRGDITNLVFTANNQSVARQTIILEHEDCTRSRYELFTRNNVFPNRGDRVEAGEPLGTVADGSNYVNGSHLRFSVYYPEITNQYLRKLRKFNNTTYSNVYLTPSFHGVKTIEARKEYLSEHPQSMIFQEMNKREIKKWKKAKGIK